MEGRKGAAVDSALYAASALLALAVPLTTEVPLDRQWARIAVPAYAIGALVSLALGLGPATTRARAVVAAAVFVAVAGIPLLVHADARTGGAERVKSDVLVIEAGAAAFVDGRNPYDVEFGAELASWPDATRRHFPYLPAMLAFGAPRAFAGAEAWTDARVVCLLVTLLIALWALALAEASAGSRLRVLQVLLVLVTGAPLVFTSAKELPVLALLLLSLVALERRRPAVSGAAAGVAAAMHQLTWVVLPFLVLEMWGTSERPRGRRSAAGIAIAVASVAIAPFVLWEAGSFVEDVVLFPLGFGQPAAGVSLSPGGLIASAFPGARWVLVAALAFALAMGVIAFPRMRSGHPGADAARGAAVLLLVLLVLAPRIRLAYLAFPLNLLVWSRLVLRRLPSERSAAGGRSATPRPAPGHRVGGGRQRERDQREEPASGDRAPEHVGLAGDPDVEDQDDEEERDVATEGGSEEVSTPAALRRWNAGRPVRTSHGDRDHREEQHESRGERRNDDLEHGLNPGGRTTSPG